MGENPNYLLLLAEYRGKPNLSSTTARIWGKSKLSSTVTRTLIFFNLYSGGGGGGGIQGPHGTAATNGLSLEHGENLKYLLQLIGKGEEINYFLLLVGYWGNPRLSPAVGRKRGETKTTSYCW
jgi:hypothetical protein